VQDVPKLLHQVLYLLKTGSKSEYVLISESCHANEARRNYSIKNLFKLLGMREGDETISVQIWNAIKRGLKNALCMREGCK
jgi:hypothetical protein